MGKRIVSFSFIPGIALVCCLLFSGCDAQDLISELVQGPDESQLAVDTDEQTSVLAETQTQTEIETETETTAVDLAWKKYEQIPYDELKVLSERAGNNGGNASVQIIESFEQLERIHQSLPRYELTSGYESDFFEQNSLILIIFMYSSGEDFQSLDGLVIKDDTICPVITIDSQDNLGCDYQYRIMAVEMQKSDVTVPAGKILVINLDNPDSGSNYHKDRFE